MLKLPFKHNVISTLLLFLITLNLSAQTTSRPRDIRGWADTLWGMNQTQLQNKVSRELEDISKESKQNADWRNSPVIPMLRLKEVTIGDTAYHADFLFSRDDQKLHGVEIVATTNTVSVQTALFQDLRKKLIGKYGRSDDRSKWNHTTSETNEYFDHQVIWNFRSTIIRLQYREWKPGMETQAKNDDLKIEYVDKVYYQKHTQDKDKL